MGPSWQNSECKSSFAAKITAVSVRVNEIPLFTGQIAKTDPTHNCRLYSVQTDRLALYSGENLGKTGLSLPNWRHLSWEGGGVK